MLAITVDKLIEKYFPDIRFYADAIRSHTYHFYCVGCDIDIKWNELAMSLLLGDKSEKKKVTKLNQFIETKIQEIERENDV